MAALDIILANDGPSLHPLSLFPSLHSEDTRVNGSEEKLCRTVHEAVRRALPACQSAKPRGTRSWCSHSATSRPSPALPVSQH